jgi:hypothetical protein
MWMHLLFHFLSFVGKEFVQHSDAFNFFVQSQKFTCMLKKKRTVGRG